MALIDGFSPEGAQNAFAGNLPEATPSFSPPHLELVPNLDTSPGEFLGSVAGSAIEAVQTAEQFANPREHEVFKLKRDHQTYEVLVESDITAADYQEITPEKDWGLFQDSVEPLRGKKVVHVSATYEGGGVAMIIPPEVHLFRQEGVDAHWFTLKPDPIAFETTKKMHNLQQDVVGPEVQFTDEDQQRHQQLGLSNFAHLKDQDNFKDADYYIIDDGQPAAMIPEIRKHFPNAKIIYRNHIQTDRGKIAREGSQQNIIQKYLREDCGVGGADVYVAHPVEDFVPYGTPNVVSMPPTCDPFEDLNRDLTPEEINDGLDFFDTEMNIQNQRLQARHHSSIYDQAPLDRNRQRITLFARFDLAKGMHIGMELQERIVAKLVENNAPEEKIPELLIAGNGSVDDPDRLWMIDEMMALRHEKHGAIKDYIKVLGVSHNYAAVNALMRTNMFAINPSTAEGFEHRATESIIKGVPAIVSNRGGLPLQVKEGVSGLVLNLDKLHNQNDLSTIDDELERAADFVVNSIIHPEKYEALKASTQKEAEEFSSRDIGTVSAVTRYAIALQGRGNRSWLLDDLNNHEEPLAA